MTTNKYKDSWIVRLACTLLAICFVGLGYSFASSREEIKARAVATVSEEESSNSLGLCQNLSLTLQAATISIPNTNDLRITTRLLNGQYPGPTLRLQAGECYRVEFRNALEDNATNKDANAYTAVRQVNNQLSAPNETNLHFHGLHISGTIPSDDVVRVVVRPGGGESYTYTIRVPAQHMGGTHWLHAHRHGSSALQVGGGAVAAVIVEDPPGTLPAAIQQAPQVLFVAHAIDISGMADVATKVMHDALWHVAGNAATAQSSTWITVNGQVQPQLELQAGVWTRIRVVWAAWRKGNLNWRIVRQGNDEQNRACQVALLAKDGIYIRDFPRWVSVLPLLPGARADVMVRCLQPNRSHVVTAKGGLPIATLRTVATTSNPPALESWTPAYPDYLQDLRATPASPQCTCTTDLTQARRQINGFLYQPDAVLHQSYLGAVVERHLITGTHPYHQHVYPFQLINDVVASSSRQVKHNVNEDGNNDDIFYRAGDWHDTIQQAVGQEDAIVVRYRPMHFSGQVMVHCHRLKHEDEGMMATELVHADDRRGCTCTLPSSSVSVATTTSRAIGCLWFVSLATWLDLMR